MANVLYVEDHPPAQMLMQAIIMEMTAHQLSLASTGEEARKMAAEIKPDLYIIDLDLPDTDGLTLARTLTTLRPAPVLLVSAYAESVKDSSLGSFITAYLAKPLDPEHVAQTIQRTLA
jgi:CheY-like chemotaxis protein